MSDLWISPEAIEEVRNWMPDPKQAKDVFRGSLFFTIGLPRSGKTQYCDKWVQTPKMSMGAVMDTEHAGTIRMYVTRPRVVVAGDDFRTAIHGREFQAESEGLVFATMDIAARALLSRGFDVIIDETSTSEATLLRYFRLDINATPVWIDTPVEVCKQRALATKGDYLLGPIDRMNTQLQHLKANWGDVVARLKTYLRERSSQDVAV